MVLIWWFGDSKVNCQIKNLWIWLAWHAQCDRMTLLQDTSRPHWEMSVEKHHWRAPNLFHKKWYRLLKFSGNNNVLDDREWNLRYTYFWLFLHFNPLTTSFCFSRWSSTSCWRPWLALGWLFLLLCINQLRKQPSGLVGPPFWQWCFFLSHRQLLAESCDCQKLVNEWVWFESQICWEELHEQFGEALSVKTQWNGEYSGPINLSDLKILIQLMAAKISW